MLLHPRSSSSNESPLGKVVRLTKGCERESSVSVTIFGTTQYLAGKSIFATVHQQTVLPYGDILANLVVRSVPVEPKSNPNYWCSRVIVRLGRE